MQINLFTLQNGSLISTKLQFTGMYDDQDQSQLEFLSWVKALQGSNCIEVLTTALLYNSTAVEYHPIRNLENHVQLINNGDRQRNLDPRERDEFITYEQAKELGLFDLDDLSIVFLKDHTVFIRPGRPSLHNIVDFLTPDELEEFEEQNHQNFKLQFERGVWINSTNVDLLDELFKRMNDRCEDIQRVHFLGSLTGLVDSDLDSITEIAKQEPIFVQLTAIETEDWEGYPEIEYNLSVVRLPDDIR